MLALKTSNALYKFTSTLNSGMRCKLRARSFAATVDNQTNTKKFVHTAQTQVPRQNDLMSLFPSLEPEMNREYMQVFPDIIRELTDFSKFTLKPNDFKAAEDHFLKMLDYTLSGGHRDQLLVISKMYQDLMVNKATTAENIKQAYLLGWSMEILLAALLMDDDILDNSDIRRGKRCWQKLEGMEKVAINDMLMLENGCYLVINRFFGHLPCYNGIMQTVTENFMNILLAQSYDYHYNLMGLDHFTLENYNHMNSLKASYFRFFMPASLAMLLAGYDFNTHLKSFEAVKSICHEIGPFYQAHNEYLDCFGDQNRLNKPGHDIQNGQFTWFATMVMELGTDQQKDILRRNYGKNDADCVAKVKQLFEELRLPELFNEYMERNQANTMQKVDHLLHTDESLRNACKNFFNQAFHP